MLDKEEKLGREIVHLLAEVVVCAGLEWQPHDVRRPAHQRTQNIVALPIPSGIDRFGQAQHRAVLGVRYDRPNALARAVAIEAERAGAAEELRRVADPKNGLEAEAERADLAGASFGRQVGKHERRCAVSIDRLPIIGAVEAVAGQPDHDSPAAAHGRCIGPCVLAAGR